MPDYSGGGIAIEKSQLVYGKIHEALGWLYANEFANRYRYYFDPFDGVIPREQRRLKRAQAGLAKYGPGLGYEETIKDATQTLVVYDIQSSTAEVMAPAVIEIYEQMNLELPAVVPWA